MTIPELSDAGELRAVAPTEASRQAGPEDEPGSPAWLARASAEILEESEESLTVQRIVERAVEVLPGCDLGGISLRRGRQAETPASTDPAAQEVDDLQYELGEGPCLDAIWVDDLYVIEDVSQESRWPRWCRETTERGIQSVLSVRLATTAETLGCLNLYSRSPQAWDADAIDLAQAYASLAASALASSRKITQLQKALDTRHKIGLAQGILMAQFKLSEAASFELLRRYSQQQNIKLRDVAARILESHLASAGRDGAGKDGGAPAPARRDGSSSPSAHNGSLHPRPAPNADRARNPDRERRPNGERGRNGERGPNGGRGRNG